VASALTELGQRARRWLDDEGIDEADQKVEYQVDVRYHRQGFELTVDIDAAQILEQGLGILGQRFDDAHNRLYGFKLDTVHEIVNVRAIAIGTTSPIALPKLEAGGTDASTAKVGENEVYFDGKQMKTGVYNRAQLKAGNQIAGPAIITEMDSTTVVLPDCYAEVDAIGSILIRPNN
jgi:N-methylhydantoinase A